MRSLNSRLPLTLLLGVVLVLGPAAAILAEDPPSPSQEEQTPGEQSAAYIKRADGHPVDPDFRETTEPVDSHGDLRGGEVDNTVVPEPGTLALIGLGLAGLGVARWRRRKQRRD